MEDVGDGDGDGDAVAVGEGEDRFVGELEGEGGGPDGVSKQALKLRQSASKSTDT